MWADVWIDKMAITPDFLAAVIGNEVGVVDLVDKTPTVLEDALPIGGDAFTGAFTADANRVYAQFVDVSGTDFLYPVAWAWPADGSGRTELARGLTNGPTIESDGEYLYGVGARALYRFPVAGGRPELVARLDFDARALALDAQNVYLVDRVFDANVCDRTAGRIFAVRKDGGQPTPVATGLDCPFFIDADETGVYWSQTPGPFAADASIARLPR